MMATSVCGMYAHYAVNVRYIQCQSSSCWNATRLLKDYLINFIVGYGSAIWNYFSL